MCVAAFLGARGRAARAGLIDVRNLRGLPSDLRGLAVLTVLLRTILARTLVLTWLMLRSALCVRGRLVCGLAARRPS